MATSPYPNYFIDDFTTNSTGSIPDWTKRIQYQSGDTANVSGGRASLVKGATGGSLAYSMDVVDNVQNIELLTKFSVHDNDNTQGGRYGILVARYSGTSEATTMGFSLTLMQASNVLSLMIVEDSTGSVDNYINFPWTLDTDYYARFRVNGDSGSILLQAKMWAANQPEPSSWTLSDTYTIAFDNPSCYSGILTYVKNSSVSYEFVSAATNGGTAWYPTFVSTSVQPGKTRITKINSVQQSGRANISKVSQLYQLGTANVRSVRSLSQQGNARIGHITQSQQQGVASINTVVSPPSGVMFGGWGSPSGWGGVGWGGLIVPSATIQQAYQRGVSRLTNTYSSQQLGVSRIQRNGKVLAQLGRARIQRDNQQLLQLGKSRVERVRHIDQTGQSFIEHQNKTIQLGIASIHSFYFVSDIEQQGKARVEKVDNITQHGTSRIERVLALKQYGKAFIEQQRTTAQSGKARIERTEKIIQLGVSRVQITSKITQNGVAHILRQPKIIQTGRGFLQRQHSIDQLGRAKIERINSLPQYGVARIQNTYTSVQYGTAKITYAVPDQLPSEWDNYESEQSDWKDEKDGVNKIESDWSQDEQKDSDWSGDEVKEADWKTDDTRDQQWEHFWYDV